MQKFWMVIGLVGVVLFGWMVVGNYVYRPSALTVIGEGKLSVPPEEVSLIVTKVTAGTDVVGAIDEGGKQIGVLTGITKTVASDARVQKLFYRINPQVGGQYLVANAFLVKTNNVSRTDELVKALYQAGATTVSDVNFTTTNPDQTDQRARIKAMADAKSKAQAIAKSASKHLGRLVSIQDDNIAPSSAITSGANIDIVKQVSVVYEIW